MNTKEQFETKLKEQFKQLIQDKEQVLSLLEEAEEYVSKIEHPDTYEQLAADILVDVRQNKKLHYKQWKSINLFVINQRKYTQTSEDDFIIL